MNIIQKIGIGLFLIGMTVFIAMPFIGNYTLSEEQVRTATKEIHQEQMTEILAPMYGVEYGSNFAFLSAFNENFSTYNDALKDQGAWDQVIWDDYGFPLAMAALESPVKSQPWIFLGLSIGLCVLGGLFFILPQYRGEPEGIKNNGIYHSSATSRGFIGIATGTFLILFYVLLYWYPAYLANHVWMVNPLSLLLSGNPASQWFLYGFIYTLAIAVMGVRMYRKYRGNKYQILRTSSVIFFQTAFAFLIPEILVLLNQPYFDFKNIWPLDYDFFYSYNLDTLISSGGFGLFMLMWGILLIIIGVPLLTYFYGKRWYCSWVCGCGGLAETVGDPYRQLSDKSLKAWKYERVIIHSVLVLAVVMTALTLVNYFMSFELLGNVTNQLHSFYGFAIGAAFSGVVGTGFYPFMGNRVWCRFGCPLAAYLGLVQRFKSRFRITTNGGQCISCGNCSTYCEMGIDVRWYAQRGQNIVRSSCVGCGVCSAVCPRGVLKLENDNEENRINDMPIIIGNDSIKVNA
ncbi:4Fe-4S binding protein [Algoriphagus sediminis]|uniref:4Fe-4S binding protein n=1 Tax=Algoriphagus sediminis TaxID=3057113 RepID=A0ABT7Y876_9BACT|nr:4Fe-4S binding protein [Algoriphagus sediminis]MDN3202712.1 4Fe-4S binding protein [Algoriphagus sediminis]